MSRFFLPLWALVLTACQLNLPEPACKPGPQEQSLWTGATRTNTAAAYRSYLAKYPAGCFAADAAQRLKKPVAKPALKAAGVAALVAGGPQNAPPAAPSPY